MNKLIIEFKDVISKITENDRKTIKGKLIYGFFWNLISALASQGFPLIAAIITARLLGTVGYGQFGMLNSTVILFSTFAGMGLGITATKYVAQYHQTDPQRTGRIIGLTTILGLLAGSLMCILLFIIAPWLATNMLTAPQLSTELRIVSILLLFNALLGIQSGIIVGFGAFKNLARIAILQGIIASILTITSAYIFGLTGVVVALVVNSAINLILYKININNLVKEFNIKINYVKSLKEKEILWTLSFPTLLSNVMVGPVIWIANTIIINTPEGYAQLGLFNAADQWKNMLLFLPYIIGGVLLPMVSANNIKENKPLETLNILASWIIVIIIAIPLISFPEIIAFLYGQEYFSTIFLQSLTLMMFVSCLLAYTQGILRKLVAKNLMWLGFLNNLVWGCMFLILVYMLKMWGSLGLSISYVIAYSIITILFIPIYLKKRVVPKNLLISKEVILIWTILIVQTIITVIISAFLIKLFVLIISVIILIFSFYRIWNKNIKSNNV